MQIQYYSTFGQVYGAGTYDTSVYGNGTTTSASSGGTAGGTLSNTGIAVAGIVTIAAVILLVAILVRIWKRPRKLELEPVEIDDAVDDTNSDLQNTTNQH